MAYAKKLRNDGIVCVDPLPAVEELQEYYAQAYYQDSDGKKTTYDTSYTDAEIEHKKLEANQLLQGLREQRDDALKVLDLGCGEGFFLKEATVAGHHVHGVDFSSYGVEKWNPDMLSSCEFGDINEWLIKAQKNALVWDAIILRNVLEHVLAPETLLQQMFSILSPQGLSLVTVPNDFSEIQKKAMDKGYIDREFWFAPPDHLHYFNTENITPFVQKAGFDVVDMFSSFPVDFFLFHSGSNYIKDSTKGKEAHFARIDLDLMMARKGYDNMLAMYRGMAACGVGRDFTVVLKKSK